MKTIHHYFILILSILAGACAPTQSLEYKGYESLKINQKSELPEIQVSLKFFNPNRMGATLSEADLNMSIGQVPVGVIQLEHPVKIPKKDQFLLPVRATTTYPQLSEVAVNHVLPILTGSQVPYSISGTITLRKYIIFKKTFDVQFADKMSLKDLKM